MNELNRAGVPRILSACLPFLFTAIFSIVLLDCAGQVSPAGGPRDLSPPAIVGTDPDTNAVRVNTQSVRLEFNKYVDRRSVEESVFFSPYVGNLEFDWSGTSVTVKFSEHLRANTTYVVNIGTDVIDVRERNRMAAGYTLAFSTGDSIDQGFISGRVFDPKPEGVMIFAYNLAGAIPDTLDPGRVKPEYIMQTGTGGFWKLSNIAFGTYRVFAVRDEYRNLVYDKEIDQFGVTQGDITVAPDHPRVPDVWFRLSSEDTTRPFLTSVRAVNRYQVQVRFSEPVDTLSFGEGLFTIVDTVSQRPVPVLVQSPVITSPAMVTLVTGLSVDSGAVYRLRVQRIFDRAGNGIDTAHATAVFQGTNRPDTLKPAVSIPGLRDSTRGYSVDQPVLIEFSKPVERAPLLRAVVLRDSSRRTIDASLRWLNATDLTVTPRLLLASKAWYQLRVVLDSARDVRGIGYRDSTFLFRFETLDLRRTGVIDGSVSDAREESGRGRIYITASSIDLKPQRERTVTIEAPGKFTLDRLVEGNYVISGFRDADSSGTYSFGRPFPFVPSERFAVYPDTVRVRARWAVSGVALRFR